ncbi:hypothetical protein [Streptomyces sp900129855]|uniref:Conjugal transfer protein n=1 Tax=Streptomyces sp. 900129855 TaxID=3155129 RepID=A0ABV2ZRY8_9ACTN
MTATGELTKGQRAVLIAATVPMIGAGGLGAWGTYTNITAEFGRAATALGVVAAGEGVTLVLALVMVLLTMFGQAAPWPVRVGLWAAPVAAALTGVVVADNLTEEVVYGITPMAMCVSAEGLGLVARRIVVYRTNVDVEAQRRNAQIMRRIAYHRARSERHPWKWVQSWSGLAAWRLLRRAGEGDAGLGVELIRVQRATLTEGAGLALGDMLALGPQAHELTAVESHEPIELAHMTPAPEAAPEHLGLPGGQDHGSTASGPGENSWNEPDPEWDEPEPEWWGQPDPEWDEPEPEQGEPEPRHEKSAPPDQPLTKTPLAPAGEQPTGGTGATQAHPNPEPAREEQRKPEPEREPAPPTGGEQQQILQLATRLMNGEAIAKKAAVTLLGVSPATAQRRMTQARRVVTLAERLKDGERLTPATAAPLLGVDEKTAELRLIEARQLNGEGTGFYT